MLLSVSNQAWMGFFWYKPKLYLRGLADGNGKMITHKTFGSQKWENIKYLEYCDRLIFYFYCGDTSAHLYLKASYEYFGFYTWPFLSYPVFKTNVIVVPETEPVRPADPGVVITEEMSENYQPPMTLDEMVSNSTLSETTINMLSKDDIAPKDRNKTHRQSIYYIADLDHVEVENSMANRIVSIVLTILFASILLALAFMSVKVRKGKLMLRKSTKSLTCCLRCPKTKSKLK